MPLHEPIKHFLHEVGEKPRVFTSLHAALLYAKEAKTTGYIVVGGPERSVINLRKGKRKAVDGRWIPCA